VHSGNIIIFHIIQTPLSPVKNKDKGKMEYLNARKEISTSEATDRHGIWVPNENVSQLEQKLLNFQEELEKVQNLANLSSSLSTPDTIFPNSQNPTPLQNQPNGPIIPTKNQCNTRHTTNNNSLLMLEPQNFANDHFHTHNNPIYIETVPFSTQHVSCTHES